MSTNDFSRRDEASTPTATASTSAFQTIQLAPKSGPAQTPVRITLRLPSGNSIAAFRVLFGDKEADSQIANEEHLADYERIVMVAPAPQQQLEQVSVIVQGMLRDGRIIQNFDAGSFAYSAAAPRPNKRPNDAMEQQAPTPSNGVGAATPDHAGASKSVPTAPVINLVQPVGTRAAVRLTADLNTMSRAWTEQEYSARRRLVQFWRQQEGNVINVTFRPIQSSEFVQHSITISCIYRQEMDECFVTSVDTVYLLEALVGVRFTNEEKNRVRRNLEGYKPQTVSKARPETEDFFRLIMSYSQPRPRNIEKDVKVFPWRVLCAALKKIIGKYSATYSTPNASLPVLATEATLAGTRAHTEHPEPDAITYGQPLPPYQRSQFPPGPAHFAGYPGYPPLPAPSLGYFNTSAAH